MNKVLVEIYVPAVQRTFDVFLPDRVPIHQMTDGIAKIISDLTEGRFVPLKDVVICDGKTGAVYDVNQDARELLLHNGSRLIMI